MQVSTKRSKGMTKITINVWTPVWSKLEKIFQAACLRRDAYIAALIERELPELEREVAVANSEKARQFIERQLRALLENHSTPLSIALPLETARKLDALCKDRGIVRDAFFNRLFLFLGYGPEMAGKLLFSDFSLGEDSSPTAWTRAVWSEYQHEDAFFQGVFSPLTAHLDPIWAIRACFELVDEQERSGYVEVQDPRTKRKVVMMKWVPDNLLCLPNRFYTVVLTDHDLLKKVDPDAVRQSTAKRSSPELAFHNLYGLNCYMPNFLIPGHPEQRAAQKATLEALEEL